MYSSYYVIYQLNINIIDYVATIFPIGLNLLYGSKQTLYCGDSDPSTPPGDWYHNGYSLYEHSRRYTIKNATFSDDGLYQCRRNGADVFNPPLKIDVYGKS